MTLGSCVPHEPYKTRNQLEHRKLRRRHVTNRESGDFHRLREHGFAFRTTAIHLYKRKKRHPRLIAEVPGPLLVLLLGC